MLRALAKSLIRSFRASLDGPGTKKELLRVLAEEQDPLSAEQIVRRSNLGTNAAPVYPHIRGLAFEGMVTCERVLRPGEERPKYVYTITDKGRQRLAQGA